MKSARTTSDEKLQANIVIIGGDGSGLAAAVAVAKAEVKNIIVLEARQEVDRKSSENKLTGIWTKTCAEY